jgi:hypothetical protein
LNEILPRFKRECCQRRTLPQLLMEFLRMAPYAVLNISTQDGGEEIKRPIAAC